MRFQNWDVLLFTKGADRGPVQEFNTACFAVYDSEPFDDTRISTSATHTRQVPILASFVASREEGSPFRVSIHSWTPPVVSGELQTLEDDEATKAMFDIRLVIDGVCVARRRILPTSHFPFGLAHVFSEPNKDQSLLWPPYYGEHLFQPHRNAGENMGRIKITISEGYCEASKPQKFVRTRNVVTFSFQHAPQPILEEAAISWPNKYIWHSPSPLQGSARRSPLDLAVESPSVRCSSRRISGGSVPARMPPPPRPTLLDMIPTTTTKGHDPFIDKERSGIYNVDGSTPVGPASSQDGETAKEYGSALSTVSDTDYRNFSGRSSTTMNSGSSYPSACSSSSSGLESASKDGNNNIGLTSRVVSDVRRDLQHMFLTYESDSTPSKESHASADNDSPGAKCNEHTDNEETTTKQQRISPDQHKCTTSQAVAVKLTGTPQRSPRRSPRLLANAVPSPRSRKESKRAEGSPYSHNDGNSTKEALSPISQHLRKRKPNLLTDEGSPRKIIKANCGQENVAPLEPATVLDTQ